jgi:hypothetical protein
MKFKFSWLHRAAFCAFACCISSEFADAASTMNVRLISWAAPRGNEDGSPLDNLMGYYVYVGDSPGTMIPYTFTPSLTRFWVYQYVPKGAHYLAITAVNVDGIESEMSPIVIL